jgi:hypothetical protein
MQVFIVTSGCYSDYGIEGVFSDEQKAIAFKTEFEKDKNSEADIEAWDVDKRAEEVARLVYTAIIKTPSGDVLSCNAKGEMVSPNQRATPKPDLQRHNALWSTGESAVSPEHAMKLAVEARQAWLRKQAEEEAANLAAKEKFREHFKGYIESGGH